MKRTAIHILLVISLLATSILGNFAPIYASDKAEDAGFLPLDSQVVLEGGYVAEIIDRSDGTPVYRVDFGAPTYCDDRITPIDTQWYEEKDGLLKSGPNKFESSVSNEQITVAKDGESAQWSPEVTLIGADNGQDMILKTKNSMPEILDVDPLNENYQRNTLVWHYDNGIDRYFRIIEGLCQEYFVINEPIQYDLVIEPNVTRTENFPDFEEAAAYDQVRTPIKLTEDDNGKITLRADSVRESNITDKNEAFLSGRQAIAEGREPEAVYPVIIDPDITFTTTSLDGHLIGSGTTYSTVRTKTSADSLYDTFDSNYVGQFNYPHYEIDRTALYFFTSSLPDDADINEAILRLYGQIDLSDTNFYVRIQNGQPTYPHIPLTNADYNQARYTGNGGSINTSSWTTSGYNEIDLNSTGRSWINKTIETKFMLRSSRDINGNTPTTTECVGFYSYEKGSGYRPQLIVTYTLPAQVILEEALDNTDLEFYTSGDADWFGQEEVYYYDDDAAQSGDIGDDEACWMETEVSGPGTLKFYWMVSSEEGYDYLNFYIDGDLEDQISGDVDWEQMTYNLGADSYTLEWEYIKDDSVSQRDDCGWVDRVQWTPLLPPTNVQATDDTFSDKIQITWNASSDATGYKIYRNTTNNSSTATQIGTDTASPYDDTSAAILQTYYYWVKAYNSYGDSAFSSSNTGRRADPPPAPFNVVASGGTFSDKIQITWQDSIVPTEYKIFRNTDDDALSATQVETTTNLFFDDTTITFELDTPYYYWVKSHVPSGDSDFSQMDDGWIPGDDNDLEVGAYWVSQYVYATPLANSDEDAQSFLTVLNSDGYETKFNIGDNAPGPLDQWFFDDTTNPSVGVDGADLFWFDGHGDPEVLLLMWDQGIWPWLDRIYGEDMIWGNSDLEWAFLHACRTLRDDDASESDLKSNGEFARALQGAHMICGAVSIMWNYSDDGRNVGEYLTGTGGPNNDELKTVKEAWFLGIDVNNYLDNQDPPQPMVLRVIAEDSSYGNDYIWGEGTGPALDVSVDDYYWSWDFECTPN